MTDLTAPHKHTTHLGRFWMDQQEVTNNLYFIVFVDGTKPNGYALLSGAAPVKGDVLELPSVVGTFTVLAVNESNAPLSVLGTPIITIFVSEV